VAQPTGIGGQKVRETLVLLRAWGEINNVPPPRLDDILAVAKKDLEEKPGVGPPSPPPTP